MPVSSDDVLAFIRAYLAEHRYPPSVRDIGEGVGLSSSSSVHEHLRMLRDQGRLTWTEGKVRTLRLVEQ